MRNALLGEPVTDIDIATTATPDEVTACMLAAGLGAVLGTGLATARGSVMASCFPFEVTTRGRRHPSPGRPASPSPPDWAADAPPRLHDQRALLRPRRHHARPARGHPDLAARRVRFIGDARERIREDELRILRFFRLTADFAEGPADAVGLAACVRERAGLAILSASGCGWSSCVCWRRRAGPRSRRLMQDYGLLPAEC